MNDSLIMLFGKIFTKAIDNNQDAFYILKSSVALKILWELYERLSLIDVPTIDMIDIEKKNKYWEIAKSIYPDKETAIKASKAAYMISLITNTD